jgi:FkbM family methyltransferase
MEIYSQLVNKLWPREKHPILRLRVYMVYRIFPQSFSVTSFFVWRLYSKIRFGTTRWVRLDLGKLCVRSADYRAYWISQTRGTQKEIIKTWITLAKLKPTLCIDVGANYGEFTLAIASFGIPTISIEPNPSIVNCLNTSFEDYQNISIVHAAISDKEGMLPFHFNPQYSGSASLSKEMSAAKVFLGQKGQTHSTEVRSVRLDSLVLNEFRINPKSLILKIDVETFELDVLRSAFTLLSKCDWWRAIVEFNPIAIRNTNGNVEEVWKIYRNFSGLIIGQDITENILTMTKILPESHPLFSCDLLIGRGSVDVIPCGR